MKNWIIEIGIKKLGPSAIRGAILGLSGWLIAREGLLSTLGIVYDQAGHIILINLDKLNLGLIALLPAVLAAVIKLLNHQAIEAMPKKEALPSSLEPPQA